MNLIREDAGGIGNISKGKRYNWITKTAAVCTCFLAVLASSASSYALDPLDQKLENGRSFRDLRTLIGVGYGMRNDALSESRKDQQVLAPLAKKLEINKPEDSIVGMLSFFMRGAIPLPMLTNSGSYVAFVNPVADSVLLTSWAIVEGKIIFEDARLVPGETLEGRQPLALTSRWTDTDAMAEKLQEVVKLAQKITSGQIRADIKRVQTIFDSPTKSDALAIRRISAAALATSGKHFICAQKLSGMGKDVRSLSLLSERTNVSRETEPYEVLPVGGIKINEIFLLVYSFKEEPGSFVFAAADEKNGCALLSLNGVKTMHY